MFRPLWLGLLSAVLLLAACAPAPAAKPTTAPVAAGFTRVQVALGFVPSVQSAPLYLAQDRGYYAAEGLEVQFGYGTIQNLLTQVAQGDIAFASTSGDALMPQRQQGVNVTYVMTFWTRNPLGALGIAGNTTPALRTPADLKGKNIGVSAPNSSTDSGLKALLQTANLSSDDVHVIAIGTTEVEALIQKRIDAAMTFLPNEAAQMKSLGLPVETIAIGDYLDYAPPGFVAGDKTIRDHPELVQKFINATLKGLRDSIADPSAAFESSLVRMPELSPDNQPLQRDVLTATLDYYKPVQGRALGATDPQTWVATQDCLRSIGVISESIDPTQYYTNTFVEHAAS